MLPLELSQGDEAYLPVAANQAPPGEVTKMIGAMQGVGSSTFVSTWELPSGSAWNASVETLTTSGSPLLSILWQLTMARNIGMGFVPDSTRTSPRVRTLNRPPAMSSPLQFRICQGRPPPGTVRMGFVMPT